MTDTLGPADYIVLVGYFLLMLAIGGYFYRYMKGMKDYFSGGNRIPWWLSGASYYMSSFSVFAFVAYSAMAYKYGIVAIVLMTSAIYGVLFSLLVMAKKWRRARIDSPIEYLEARFSPALRQLFAWQGIPLRIIDDALKLVAIGLFISAGLGLELYQSVLWSGLIMLTYTMLGGLWAVTVTDFIQFVVMAVAMIILVPLSIQASGGLSEAFINLPSQHFEFLHPPEYDLLYYITQIVLMVLAYSSINWSLIQRFYSVPNEKDTTKLGWFVIILFIIGTPIMMLPALLAPNYLTLGPEQDGMVYALLAVKLLPTGLIGLVIAAMFAATMSMLSSDYNVAASVLTNDVYLRLIRKSASQKELVLVGRVMTIVVGLSSLSMALFMLNLGGEGLFRGMMQLFSIFTAPVAIPMIFGLVSKKLNKNGALTAFLLSFIFGIILFFTLSDETQIGAMIIKREVIIMFGTAILAVIGIYVGSIFPATEEEEKKASDFMKRLEIPIGEMEVDIASKVGGSSALSPFRIISFSLLYLGLLLLIILFFVPQGVAFYMDLFIGLLLVMVGSIGVLKSKKSSLI
jgi:SSS family transporter